MYVYLIALGVSVLVAIIYERNRNYNIETYIEYKNGKLKMNKNILLVVIAAVPLTFVSGIRYNVGTDYSGTYMQIFNATMNNTSVRDGGYGVLNKFVQLFTDDYAGIFLFTSLLIGFLFYFSIYEQSALPVVSILLYVFSCTYFISMNMIRQTLATAIYIYATKYIFSKDLKKYYIYIILAITIHTSAMVYLLMPVFYKFVLKYYKVILIGLLFIFIYSNEIVNVIQKIIHRLPYIRNYFSWYFNSMYSQEQRLNYGELLIQGSVLVLYVIAYISNSKNDKLKYYACSQILAVGVLLISTYMPLAERISYLFTFSNCIFIPNVIIEMKDRKLKTSLITGIMVLYGLYMFYAIVVQKQQGVLPYQTIFDR